MITVLKKQTPQEYIVDFTALRPQDWQNVRILKFLVDNIYKATKIITADGVHDRIQWSSPYLDVLTHHCKDPRKADILNRSFEESFKDMREGKKKTSIRKFIKKNHIFIGQKKPVFDFSKSDLSPLINDEFTARFNAFLDLVSQRMKDVYDNIATIKDTDKTGIAIITSNAGAGHRMVAKAMGDMLNAHRSKKYVAKVINIDELPTDLLSKISNGAINAHQIFYQFRYQENNTLKADYCDELLAEVKHFIPNSSSYEVNRQIKELGASIVLNTLNDIHWASPLADLKTPVSFVNADYEIFPQILDLAAAVETVDFKVHTPIDYKHSCPNIVPVGFPVRPGFEEIATDAQKIAVRARYHVQPGEVLLPMQMGSLGIGLDKEIKNLMKAAKKLKRKAHIVILCGNNQVAKDAVLKAQAVNKNPNLQLHSEGMLDDVKLSHLFQAGDMKRIFGKPGGSTTGEIRAFGGFLMAHKPLPWEHPNYERLKADKQAVKVRNHGQLIKIINRGCDVEVCNRPQILDWKKNLLKIVDDTHSRRVTEAPLIVRRPFSNSKLQSIFKRHLARVFKSIATLLRYLIYALGQILKSKPRSIIKRAKTWIKYS